MVLIVVVLIILFIYKREKLVELIRREKLLAISFFTNNAYLIFIFNMPIILTLFYFNSWGFWDYEFLYDISNDYWLYINWIWLDLFIAYILASVIIKFNSFSRRMVSRFYFRSHFRTPYIFNLVRKVMRLDNSTLLFFFSITLLIFIVVLIKFFGVYHPFFISMQRGCLGLSIILWLKEYSTRTFPLLKFLFSDEQIDLNKLKEKNKISFLYPIVILLIVCVVADVSNLMRGYFKSTNVGGFDVNIDSKNYYLILKTKSFYYLYDTNNIVIQPVTKDELIYQRKSNVLKKD